MLDLALIGPANAERDFSGAHRPHAVQLPRDTHPGGLRFLAVGKTQLGRQLNAGERMQQYQRDPNAVLEPRAAAGTLAVPAIDPVADALPRFKESWRSALCENSQNLSTRAATNSRPQQRLPVVARADALWKAPRHEKHETRRQAIDRRQARRMQLDGLLSRENEHIHLSHFMSTYSLHPCPPAQVLRRCKIKPRLR